MCKYHNIVQGNFTMFSSERQFRGAFVLVPALLVVYWLSLGMSVRAVATVTGWLAIQTAFGTSLLQGFAKERALPTLDSLGLGFACGALSLVVARQVSLFLSIPEWSFLAIMIAISLIHICRRLPRIDLGRNWSIEIIRLPVDSLILVSALTGTLLGSREFIPIARYLTGLGVLLLGFIVGSLS
ncbi:MAG: hypothetical protein EBU98_03900, partial [Actinobacteria bacterium]|nr:hypothetical protein [Actinomycetota bacterium]